MSYLPRPFPLFGQQHLLLLALMVIGGALWILIAQRMKERGSLRTFEVCAASWITIQYLAERVAYLVLRPEYRVVDLLPFQLCGLSTILCVWLLIKANRLGFNILYIWGFGGATMGLLMPEVEYNFPHPLNLTFFLGHAFPLYVVAHLMVVRRFRPHIKMFPTVFLITMSVMAIMLLVNPLLGTNYLFVNGKPMGGEVLDFMGEWPAYIPWMIAFGTFVAFLLHLPFVTLRNRPAELLDPEPAGD